MPDIIKLLPDSIANQIAAGEVVQRPASVVKELIENSLDAGSTKIKLILKEGGKTLIQVVDNGGGMSETDARMCFERHATSKISSANDLFALKTMGFRGEAMASIAAVAHVELKTCKQQQQIGTQIIIAGSEVKSQTACQCAEGTNIAVKNLFFNVPARRNFLKSETIEYRHILEEFLRIAIANPNVELTLHHNDHEIYRLPATNLKKRIINVLGNNYNERIVPIEENADFMRIYGFIGKPENSRKTRGEQYFFVNQRYIKSSYLHSAVMGGYEGLIAAQTFPLYVIFIDIEPQKIDVNVHPTKQEIKFDDERTIYAFLLAAIKRAINTYNLTPSIDFEQEMTSDFINAAILGNNLETKNNATSLNFEQHNKNQSNYSQQVQNYQKIPSSNWKQLYEIVENQNNLPEGSTITIESAINAQQNNNNNLLSNTKNHSAPPYQLQQRYVLSPIKSGFVLIDQQAAHEKIIFEKLIQSFNNQKNITQRQLFPQTINLPTADAELFKQMLPDINNLGYDIQEINNNSFLIQGVPSDLPNGNETHAFETLLEQFKNETDLNLPKRHQLAKAMAKSQSIKSGQRLSPEEMQTLADQLFACPTPQAAPNGKATFITFSMTEIEKMFDKK